MKKQLDEMEKSIQTEAQAFAYKATILLLSLWTLYESYTALTTGKLLNIFPCLVLTAASAAQGFYALLQKRKMIRGDEEYKEPNKALVVVLSVIALAAVIACAGSFLLLQLRKAG